MILATADGCNSSECGTLRRSNARSRWKLAPVLLLHPARTGLGLIGLSSSPRETSGNPMARCPLASRAFLSSIHLQNPHEMCPLRARTRITERSLNLGSPEDTLVEESLSPKMTAADCGRGTLWLPGDQVALARARGPASLLKDVWKEVRQLGSRWWRRLEAR